MPDPVAVPDPADCYCGWLGWTVEQYGRVTHKEGCPARTDPWHQGDPFPAVRGQYRLRGGVPSPENE